MDGQDKASHNYTDCCSYIGGRKSALIIHIVADIIDHRS